MIPLGLLALTGGLSGCNGNFDPANGPAPLKKHQGPVTKGELKRVAESIDESSLTSILEYLTGEAPAPLDSGTVRISERGTASGRLNAAKYMKESFEKMGYDTRILTFSSSGRTGYNVEATLPGESEGGHLWVSAHLDSVTNPGASDDASGLTSVLLTARALQESKPRHTVHFVAFDLEEIGLVGSGNYFDNQVEPILNSAGEHAIIGNIHSDMIGWDEGQNEGVIGSCDQGGPLPDAFLEVAELLHSPIDFREDCLGRSDHEQFWDAGLPAMILTDSGMYDEYPWYHEAGDTVDKLNIPYLRAMIQATAATVAELAFNSEE